MDILPSVFIEEPLLEEGLPFIVPIWPDLPLPICVPFIEPDPVVPDPIVDLVPRLVVDDPFIEPEELVVLPEVLPLLLDPVVVCAWALKVAMPTSMAPNIIAFFMTLS